MKNIYGEGNDIPSKIINHLSPCDVTKFEGGGRSMAYLHVHSSPNKVSRSPQSMVLSHCRRFVNS